mgnify:CR=1 FL=1
MSNDLDRKTKQQIDRLKRIAKKQTNDKRKGTRVETELNEKNRQKDKSRGKGWRDLF